MPSVGVPGEQARSCPLVQFVTDNIRGKDAMRANAVSQDKTKNVIILKIF